MQSHATHVYKNPENYSKNNTLQYSFAMDVIAKAKLDKNSRLLDIGCGDGRITCELAKITNSGCVIGTDISEKMTAFANETYKAQQNLLFIPMDASKNIFNHGQFNVITSFNCLHWVKDQAAALRGISSAAAENARIILLLSHKKSNYHHAQDKVCTSEKWKKYFQNYSDPRSFYEAKVYNELLRASGLRVDALVEREMVYRYDSIAKLTTFLTSSMANIKQIPDQLKDDFLNDYCNEFLRLSECKATENIPVFFWCLEIFASKAICQQKTCWHDRATHTHPQTTSRISLAAASILKRAITPYA